MIKSTIGNRQDDPENRACGFSRTREKPLARLSPRLPRRRESKRHLFVVDSLDKHMQNEKELIEDTRYRNAALDHSPH